MFTKHVKHTLKIIIKITPNWYPNRKQQLRFFRRFWGPQPRMGSRASPDRLQGPKAFKNGAREADFRRLLEQRVIESLWFMIVRMSWTLEMSWICLGYLHWKHIDNLRWYIYIYIYVWWYFESVGICSMMGLESCWICVACVSGHCLDLVWVVHGWLLDICFYNFRCFWEFVENMPPLNYV